MSFGLFSATPIALRGRPEVVHRVLMLYKKALSPMHDRCAGVCLEAHFYILKCYIMITFFAFQEALLNTPIADSGRPEVVLRSSEGRSEFFLSGHFFRPLSVETVVFDN